MKPHTLNMLKLCRHSGITNHSITHSITLIKKELKAFVQSFSFFNQMIALKVGISISKKTCINCFIEIPLKMMKNAFYFIIKDIFVRKIFKFLFLFKFLLMQEKRLD